MKTLKRIFASAVILIVMLGLTPPPYAGYNTPISFDEHTTMEIDGERFATFREVAPGVVSSMINPRTFANIIDAVYAWDDVSRTITFNGMSATGVETSVLLTLENPSIFVNGKVQDIALLSGQPELEGQLFPVVFDSRIYVPVRVLANIFGLPVSFENGTVILG
ncbi:MAG: copper amine oxidase N-terminal domain-containing protein [Clostridiales bacterium]|jgi:hypothetical protein|nr:copper amine oxidase N-terminal domain-containing protein [Clostridiales bacterium]